MRKVVLILLALYSLANAVSIPWLGGNQNKYETVSYDLSVEIVVINNSSKALENSDLIEEITSQWAFINTSYQRGYVLSVEVNGSSAAFSIEGDKYGNVAVSPNLGKVSLKPKDSLKISYLFHVDTTYPRESFNLAKLHVIEGYVLPENLKEYVEPVGIWQWEKWGNLEYLKELAYSFKKNSTDVLNLILNIIEWFKKDVKYSLRSLDPVPPNEVLELREGDCDDQANLFVAFCRINDVPAYTEVGAVYLPGYKEAAGDDVSKFTLINVGYHAWVRAYVPSREGGAWIPIDLTYAKASLPQDCIYDAAILKSNTVLNARIVDLDYISLIKAVKDEARRLGVLWTEQHEMKMSKMTSSPTNLPLHTALLAALALSTVMAFSFAMVVKRMKGA